MKILVTGGSGFIGAALVADLERHDHTVWAPTHHDMDLLEGSPAFLCNRLKAYGPEVVVHLAKPASDGIATMQAIPYSWTAQALRMDLAIIDACIAAAVPGLVCLGSVCSYPETAPLPMQEDALWSGPAEPVNAAYGVAKRMQLVLLHAAYRQHHLEVRHIIKANTYGPGDRSGHVIPALITKVRRALLFGEPVVVWGHPDVTRSFLYIDDAAEGIRRIVEHYPSYAPVNLASREEISMGQLISLIAALLGYTGPVSYDLTQPMGHPRRSFDITRLRQHIGWEPATSLLYGLRQTIDWQVVHVPVN